MPTLQEQFDEFTSHIDDSAQRQLVFDYITRFPGLSFDTSIDDYLLNPAPSLTPGFEAGFTGEFRWGNWVGAGTGAGRFSNHQDFTPSEFLVSARDVFDAIGRTHDLSIFQASATLTNALAASGGNYVAELEAVRQFLLERAQIDADFSDAVSALGIRDGLVGYEVQIRELGLAIMEWGAEGYAASAEQVQSLITLYQLSDASMQADIELIVRPDDLRDAQRASFSLIDEIGSVLSEFRATTVPSQNLINSAAHHFDQILLGHVALPGVGVFYPDDRANARNEFLNEFEATFGSEARERLVQALEQSCFVAGTPITLWNGETKAIEDITCEDVVLTFDAHGTGKPGVVDKLFTNTTRQLVEVTFESARAPLVTTPGHSFMTETGLYVEIGQLLKLGGGTVRLVDTDGNVVTASAEVIEYSAETAAMFEQSEVSARAANGNARGSYAKDSEGWATYNFEVRDHHNYVAGEIRVHNDSILSKIEDGDVVLASNDDLTQVAVLRDVDGDGDLDVVVMEGIRDAAGNANTQVLSTNVYLDNGETYSLSTGGTGNLAERVQDVLSQSFASGASDGVTSADGVDPWNNSGISDDFEEVLFDDVLGLAGDAPATRGETRALYSYFETQLGDTVFAAPDLTNATDLISLQAAFQDLATAFNALNGEVSYFAGTGDRVEPAYQGLSGAAALAFLVGMDLGLELVPAVVVDGPFGPIEVTPAITLGSLLDTLVGTQAQFDVIFGEGIAPADVSQAQAGDDLVLTIANADGSSSTLTLEGVYSDGNTDEVANIVFYDGTTLSLDDLPETATGDGIVTGTDGADIIDASYTDVDGDVVTAGDDTVMGGLGDDYLAAGTGNDAYDGGEGVDTVYLAGAADEFVFSFDGALMVADANGNDGSDEGSDTLSNIEQLDYADGNSAEIVEGVDTISITQNSAAGVRLALTVLDTGETRSWESYTTTFAADGVTRTDQVFNYDDGRVLNRDFDASGLRSSQTMSDVDNAHAWTDYTTTFAADGATRTDQVFNYDDGRVLDRDYDASGLRTSQTMSDDANAHAWTDYTTTFAADGATRTDQVFNYDDGRVLDRDYDANGVRTSQTMSDDANAHAWTDYTTTFAADGATRTDQVFNYDDGRVLDRDFDASGLRTMQTMTDVDDHYSWASYTQTFDAEGNVTDTTYVYDIA